MLILLLLLSILLEIPHQKFGQAYRCAGDGRDSRKARALESNLLLSMAVEYVGIGQGG